MADDDAKPAAAAAAAAADDDSDVEMSGECVETPRGLGGVRDTSCARYLFARWSTKIYLWTVCDEGQQQQNKPMDPLRAIRFLPPLMYLRLLFGSIQKLIQSIC